MFAQVTGITALQIYSFLAGTNSQPMKTAVQPLVICGVVWCGGMERRGMSRESFNPRADNTERVFVYSRTSVGRHIPCLFLQEWKGMDRRHPPTPCVTPTQPSEV